METEKNAHAASVQALIAVLCALVILGGRHDLDGLAICKGQHGNLASGHELFDDHLVAGCAEFLICHNRAYAVFRFFQRAAD